MSISLLPAVSIPFALLTALTVSGHRQARAARRDALSTRALLQSSNRDRQRAALRLHNATLQELSAARISLQIALRNTSTDHPSREMLDTSSRALGNAISDVLDTAGDLYPEDIAATRLRLALDRMVNPAPQAGRRVCITVQFDTPPSPGAVATLYRCIRECVKDVRGRALTSTVQIDILGDAREIHALILQDGEICPPPDTRQPGQTAGVALAATLAAAAGGDLHVVSPAGPVQPTKTIIAIPVHTLQ